MIVDTPITFTHPFEYDVWGAFIRNKRKNLGFIKADEFCKHIQDTLNYYITPQTLLKIERGDQQPSITQFIALNLICDDTPFPSNEMMNVLLCNKWQKRII